jgi:hypothetical protein
MPTDTTIVKPAAPLFDAPGHRRLPGPLLLCHPDDYATDLRQFFTWCAQCDLEVFAAKRGHIELYARTMEERGLARQSARLAPSHQARSHEPGAYRDSGARRAAVTVPIERTPWPGGHGVLRSWMGCHAAARAAS